MTRFLPAPFSSRRFSSQVKVLSKLLRASGHTVTTAGTVAAALALAAHAAIEHVKDHPGRSLAGGTRHEGRTAT
ncbi:MAG TPA: hypothetical protein VFC78_18060 [Tepidisphaeraceae bacterium]|nr:hypothetical protein [Tepidisphaeraceae bacterium]